MNKAKRALSIIVGAICIFGAVGLTSCKKDGPSVGLEYTLSADGTYYAVTGMGECEAKKLIIPSKHEGLPVK